VAILSKHPRVYVKSYGCSTNLADGETIVGCLVNSGYPVVDKIESADIVVYNTCAVKTPTENRLMSILEKTPTSKKIVVTGCMPLICYERMRKSVRFHAALGPAPGSKISEALYAVECGKEFIDLKSDYKPNCGLPRIPRNAVVGITPVCYGCLGACSYCCVRFARGNLRSYPINELVARVKCDLRQGSKEIWLTAQDAASYGRDLAVNLARLINAICEIEGKFFIRVGMMTPNHAMEILEELIEAYENAKVFKFLHLPLQSGDDCVLKAMNRGYSAEDFRKVVRAFKERFPMLTISTDVICSYPGEDEDAFRRTMELIEEVKPDIVNVSKFSPRPGTPTARMEQLPGSVTKNRSERMTELARRLSLDKNRAWTNWKGEIVIDEKGKNQSWVGRNFAYKPIVVRSGQDLLGEYLQVKVTGASTSYLGAEIVE